MAKASKVRQLGFAMQSRVGLLADVTGALAANNVNITAIVTYEMEGQAVFLMIVDSNAKAKKALAALNADIVEDDVLLVEVPDRPGSLHDATQRVASAGIDIHYVHATAGRKTGTQFVMQTADNNKALRALRA